MFLTIMEMPFEDLRMFSDTTDFQVVTAHVTHIQRLRAKRGSRVQCVNVSSVDTNAALPNSESLGRNYPNPSNLSSTSSYSIAKMRKSRLSSYNMPGYEVTRPVDEYVQSGQRSLRFDSSRLFSGTHFYALKTADVVVTRRVTLRK
jgi:hypothetical protein